MVGPTTRIAAQRKMLGAADLRIAEVLVERAADVVEMTAQQLADVVGVGRSSVVRLCQALGYRGFPQLRVALAAELAQRREEMTEETGTGALGAMQRGVARVARLVPELTSLLDAARLDSAVAAVVDARRLVVVASGLSGPLGVDLALRLTAQGRVAEYQPDALAQLIVARGLGAGDAVVAISASGSSRDTVAAADAAARAGAHVVAITSFHGTALARVSDDVLLVAGGASFREELEQTSRVAHAIFLEALVMAIGERLGARGARARARAFEAISEYLADEPE